MDFQRRFCLRDRDLQDDDHRAAPDNVLRNTPKQGTSSCHDRALQLNLDLRHLTPPRVSWQPLQIRHSALSVRNRLLDLRFAINLRQQHFGFEGRRTASILSRRFLAQVK